MESSLKNVARFVLLLTRNPSTEDLLNALMRDFLSPYSVTAIEIQVLGREGTLLIKKSVGQPIEGDEANTHTFTVGGANFSAGKYNAIVSYPTLAYGAKQTVSYEVTNSGTAVSNADVLKAIVSLIASINKQIAALQKALLKKK
jgi:hypothetical protein